LGNWGVQRREIASGLGTLEWMILERGMPLRVIVSELEIEVALGIGAALEKGDVLFDTSLRNDVAEVLEDRWDVEH
jgi:hypothetical protein